MAKMFYTLEEAAHELGTSEDSVKDMASNGKLQQFRDGSKLMFKREQVDKLSTEGVAVGGGGGTGTAMGLADSGGFGSSDDTSLGGMTIADETSMGGAMDDETSLGSLSGLQDAVGGDATSMGGGLGLSDTGIGTGLGGGGGGGGFDLGMSDTGLGLSVAEPEKSKGGRSASPSDTGVITLADTGDNDAIDLAADTGPGFDFDMDDSAAASGAGGKAEDPRQATGVSVFDTGEFDSIDPAAQTQMTSRAVDDDELALESVGSGSGLLDLTRESDDTSLGAELLDEIYPGVESDAKLSETGVGSSGVFEGHLPPESGPSGLDHLVSEPVVAVPVAGEPTAVAATYEAEPSDPAGSGLGAGFLLGTMAALIIGMIVMIAAIAGAPSDVTAMLSAEESSPLLYAGVLLVVSVILGVVGYFIGKAIAR